MINRKNKWKVENSRISFLEQLLHGHGNVDQIQRSEDILFYVKRKSGMELVVLCLDEYSFGITALNRARYEFPMVNIISVGGNWNGYTPEAKAECLRMEIGLYNLSEIAGGLWRNDYWNYVKKDKNGNTLYQFKTA